MNLINALNAEFLKLKRTLALWLVIIAPAIVVFTRFLEWIRFTENRIPLNMDLWVYYSKSVLTIWSMLMLPLFIILEMALINSLEHNENNWKLIFTFPVKRSTIYLAKLLIGTLMVFLGMLALWILIPLSGIIIDKINPKVNFTDSIPFFMILKYLMNTFISSLLIISIHHWISTRWPGFTLALGVGIAAIFMGLVATSSQFGKFFPWSLPTAAVFGHGERLLTAFIISIMGTLIVTILGARNTNQRDIL